MKHFLRLLILVAGAGLIAAQSKIAPDVKVSQTKPMDVIVQYKTPPTKSEISALGPYAQIEKQFLSVCAMWVWLSGPDIQTLAKDPNVLYISPNRSTMSSLDITTTTVNANVAWNLGLTGTGIGVAVIDSGIYGHDDLQSSDDDRDGKSRIVYNESFVPGKAASDPYGHGTHVAGIIGSNGNDSTGHDFKRTLKGVAPNVNLINLRVLDANGAGTDAGVIAAIEQAIALKNTYNIRVINLSLGRGVFESYALDPLCQAAEAAWKAGIVVVVAAGNFGRDNSMGEHGYGTILAPANDPYVITVGAMNDMGTPWRGDDQLASYSSKGPTAIDHIVKPDLVAPGNGTVSLMSPGSLLATHYPGTLVPNSYYQIDGDGNSNKYMRLSGTSMATPAVSGAAALLLQRYPWLTPNQVKARLMKTAQKALPRYSVAFDHFNTLTSFNLQSDVFSVGAGYLDIGAALYSQDLASMPALSAVATYHSLTHLVTISRNFLTSWGNSVVWGDGAVYGLDVFVGLDANGFSVVWGDTVIWGMDDGGGGFSVVWGDSVILPFVMRPLDAGDGDFSVVWGD